MAARGGGKRGGKDTPGRRFDPRALDRSVIAIPLLERMERAPRETHAVIFDVNLEFHEGQEAARRRVLACIARAMLKGARRTAALRRLADLRPLAAEERRRHFGAARVRGGGQYVFAQLPARAIEAAVREDAAGEAHERAIFRVWPDFELKVLLTKSASTIKATAARKAFDATGRGIVWAVLDSGIDGRHEHFKKHGNLHRLPAGLKHRDFDHDPDDPASARRALTDDYGHGTHVAGILAGELGGEEPASRKGGAPAFGVSFRRAGGGAAAAVSTEIAAIAGIAPECKLLSLRVLDARGAGYVSAAIEALEYVHELNGFGRHLRVHGVNMSLGYGFDPEWFACGQSPLCDEVNRLVASGVVVVIAAGNSGYGKIEPDGEDPASAGLMLTIDDPGNAERAITVGSTHREMPHVYGVSYFSSKGPTGDGRRKPDLVAPGEKVVSCAAGGMLEEARAALRGGPRAGRAASSRVRYVESSGTSMAAPHVSGAIAAFLSVRREFIGQTDRVKQIFMDSATDLGREGYFQGRGLLDVMRAIQSV